MQTELNHTVKSLFNKENLDDLSREDLLLMTTKYPYSSILQFLYTRKLQSQQDLRYAASVAKTALYFSNPHWLHHQLRTRSSVEILAEKEKAYVQSHPAPEVTLDETLVQPFENPEPEMSTPGEIVLSDAGLIMPVEEAVVADIPTDTAIIEEPEVIEPENQPLADEQIPVHDVTEIIKPENIFELTENIKPELATEYRSIDEPKLIPEPELISPPEIRENDREPEPEITEQSPGIDITEIRSTETVLQEEIPDITQPIEEEEREHAETIAPENSENIELPEDIVVAEQELPFEPLYAVDYFASQGIRLREEDQQDQLGKKLKSFTEWLKSMKKIHPEKSRDQFDAKTEAYIKSEADQSNDNAGVLTETMAEVLIKQGLTQKAIEVYEKLSLLDPAKSATFAAKISELKAIGT